jgi:YHS domain-containing protein
MSLTTLRDVLFAVVFFCTALASGAGLATARDEGVRRLALLPPVVGVTRALRTDTLSGLALDGFDPVSYFLQGEPLPGRAEYETLWAGAAWRFASEANRAAFLSHPNAYAPRIGGYDALAMGQGRAIEASPRIATIVERRLYLFKSSAERDSFLADANAVTRAETFWREAIGELARE